MSEIKYEIIKSWFWLGEAPFVPASKAGGTLPPNKNLI